MRLKARYVPPLHLASIPMASWVALLLAFILSTHTFWCGLGGNGCDDVAGKALSALTKQSVASAVVQVATPHTVHHVHPLLDVCSGTDETRILSVATPVIIPPFAIWITLLFAAFALVLVSLFQRAAVFGRDGPVWVPPLHSRLVRTSLPHRAPPVFLI